MSIVKALAALKHAAAKKVKEPQAIIANPTAFFAKVKTVTGGLTQTQVDTINAILSVCRYWSLPWVAYALATAWHEAQLIPQPEWGKGKGRKYGKPGKYGQVPYGRGLVQITWDYNYEWLDGAAAEVGLIERGDLLANFDLALRPDIAVFALVNGMEHGRYNPKGKGIAHYIPASGATREDYVKARTLVNLNDKAGAIADYALKFGSALYYGGWDE